MRMEPLPSDVSALVQALSSTHQQLQTQAARSVDTALVVRNWLFGWHIVEFERMLAEEGTTIVKIYLHISKAEQKIRLESRLENPDKHWKFNPDDLKDRALWDDFMETYEDLLGKTSTEHAPWYIIPANRKWYRNLVVARIMVDALRQLKMDFPPITWDPSTMVIGD